MAAQTGANNSEVFLNTEEQIVYIRYKGSVNAELTAGVYQKLGQMIAETGDAIIEVKGCIFDFCEVTDIDIEAMTAAARKSVSFRLKNAEIVANIPTALLVKTPLQEVMVRGAMKMAHQNDHPRYRLVKSVADAKKHFAEFNAQKTKPSDVAQQA